MKSAFEQAGQRFIEVCDVFAKQTGLYVSISLSGRYDDLTNKEDGPLMSTNWEWRISAESRVGRGGDLPINCQELIFLGRGPTLADAVSEFEKTIKAQGFLI